MESRRAVLRGAVVGAVGAMGGGSAMSAAGEAGKGAPVMIEGPVGGGLHGWAFGGYYGDLTEKGYVEEEYFLSGTARAFAPTGDLAPDGRWTVDVAGSASYKTRLLVRRPIDPRRFNGTVIIEWANVSFGFDTTFVDGPGLYDGFAYVSISAQRVGVAGYAEKPQGLVQWDPDRYGGLSIPSDALSYDIFTQGARAVGPGRHAAGVDPMAGLRVRTLIATGASQSGGRLLSYINAIQPREGVFDALMPVVFAGASAPFGDVQLGPGGGRPSIVFSRARDDLTAPVLALNTESEALYYHSWRQPDGPRFRSWDVAGAAHGPTGQVLTIRQKTRRDGVTGHWDAWTNMSDVEWLPTADAAIRHLQAWATGGRAAPIQPPIAISGAQPAVERDTFGNALGGVRLPELEAPVARYAGLGEGGALSGETHPFDAETLRRLYPTREAYVARVAVAARAAEQAGVILPYRTREYEAAAQANAAALLG